MLLTSVGNDSKFFVPRIRRNRKGSGCSTDPKSTCLACRTSEWRNTPCLEERMAPVLNLQPAEGAGAAAGTKQQELGGSGDDGLHQQSASFITRWRLEWSQRLFLWQRWYPPSLPTYRSTGILVDRSPGNPIPWSHVSQEPRSVLELWRKEDEGCRDNGTRGCFKVCTGLVLESLRLVHIGSTEGAGELGLGSSSSWLFRAL